MTAQLGRRDMLKSILAAAAGLGAGRLADILSLRALHADPDDGTPMPTRPLGRTGHDVGLFSIGGESTVEQRGRRDEAVAIINKALDLGVNYIDTSHIYGGGGSEENIGAVMQSRREEVYLATKTRARDYDGAMRECEVSLRRLRTDHIDLYQHHLVRSDAEIERITGENGALRAFRKLREEGVVRHLGITGHSSRVLANALRKYDYDCALITLNPAGMHMDDTAHLEDFFRLTAEKQTGVVAMKVAGKGGIFGRGINIKQALEYALSYPVCTAIVGITEIGQIEENAAIARAFSKLDDEEMKHIRELASG